jgi:hypothetical protein
VSRDQPPNNALQPIAGAVAAGVNSNHVAPAPPSAERGRYAHSSRSGQDLDL